MQHEITAPLDLLDGEGRITEEGWARKPFWNYDRSRIAAPWHRIKEWDYYAVLSHDKGYGITFTIADLSYIALCAVCWLDFNSKSYVQLDTIKPLSRGRIGFPPSSVAGDIFYEDKKIKTAFVVKDSRRIISVEAPSFVFHDGSRGLAATIELAQDPKMDTMAIATSWKENRRAFYYNQKVNCMPARGTVTIGSRSYHFSPKTDFGCLDWGRGNWTFRNRWYWGSASGLVKGVPFGWNIGYGFSDRTSASENMLFYRGKAHKLQDVIFHIDTKDYMKPWKFTSNDGRFEMDFAPIIDRSSSMNLLVMKSIQHQVFGTFSGHVTLDDGNRLSIENFLGFAEDVLNWW
ncbi:MAG TPA: DUF2804 domain-containing protein [Spirochaetota bacterium]|nr:DUF2804 domain-containing protein [Spirochaetota bacterium]HPC40431.1 DUF2804 domain-containing protein [Spirochaetota bacterium]HPL18859.1 DUF2804 domain-containing protein [Spirochaetota bacterium]HQF06498.1 DUF2804 domain-containing protein [Spirochaetota bacterium]HQH98083.1 DUF2804 domain-containing protein [Spirochaetota bacterium]